MAKDDYFLEETSLFGHVNASYGRSVQGPNLAFPNPHSAFFLEEPKIPFVEIYPEHISLSKLKIVDYE